MVHMTTPAPPAPLTDEEVAEIEARDAWLRDESNWWRCADCEWCSDCKRLAACPEHDDDDAVPRLIAELRAARAEVDRLRDALRRVMDVGDRAAVDVAHDALGEATEWHPLL